MSRHDVRRYLVAYDVPNDQRRLRLAKVLQSYGDRVQYSVFIVDAAEVKERRMRRALLGAMNTDADSVLIADLGPVKHVDESRFITLGRARPITGRDSFNL